MPQGQKKADRISVHIEIFEKNTQMIEHGVAKDEIDFPLQTPISSQSDRIYFKDQKCLSKLHFDQKSIAICISLY